VHLLKRLQALVVHPHGSTETRRRRRRLASSPLAVVLPALALAISACSSGAGASSPGGRYEIDISHNTASTVVGEPEIATDPHDQNNLFVAWATFPVPVSLNSAAPPRSCGGAVSNDGGRHWHYVAVPINHLPNIKGCEDGVAASGPDGTLYASGDFATFTGVASGGISVGGLGGIVVHGQDWVAHSSNWGTSWSSPIETMGSDATRFVRGAASVPIDTFDRPWIAVDQSTNTVYAIGHNIVDHDGYVTASTNDAQSFGPVYPTDSASFPHDSRIFGGNAAASRGIVATAYTASSAPGEKCPCVIFETSTDRGGTWDRHVVPLTNASADPAPYIAAEPSQKGRFALTVFDSTGTQNQVYVTSDSGATWQGPAVVAESPQNLRFKPWISYGPTGDIALVWRTWHGPAGSSPYDVWAAVGRQDGQSGPVFSAPMRISSATGRYPGGYVAGDDVSWIIADKTYAYVAWGDARSGPVQCWVARIPLTDFHVPSG
jgi:hypothetical protein